MGFNRFRPEGQSTLVHRDGFLEFAMLTQHVAKVPVGSSKARIKLGGLGKMSNGIIQTTNRAQGQSDVVVESGNPIV